jgi:glyoxylase-like metal-dependent hydrolase (beta-lactamase superfamily II)
MAGLLGIPSGTVIQAALTPVACMIGTEFKPAPRADSGGSIMSTLSYDVFVSDGVPRVTELRMPDGSGIVSSPVSSTLFYGERDAVLADPSWTVAQTEALGEWIERAGKRLAYIYITHGHGDHWFGTAQLLERFPGATVYATEGTIRLMHQQADSRPDFWDKIFPGLIGETPVLAQPIPAGGFELEGNQLHAIEVGHTDTDDTTVLHVPSIGLVVAGDVAYNGVHQMLLEIGGTGLKSWLDAIDQVAALHPSRSSCSGSFLARLLAAPARKRSTPSVDGRHR